MMSEFEKQVRHALIDRDMTMTDLDKEIFEDVTGIKI